MNVFWQAYTMLIILKALWLIACSGPVVWAVSFWAHTTMLVVVTTSTAPVLLLLVLCPLKILFNAAQETIKAKYAPEICRKNPEFNWIISNISKSEWKMHNLVRNTKGIISQMHFHRLYSLKQRLLNTVTKFNSLWCFYKAISGTSIH